MRFAIAPYGEGDFLRIVIQLNPIGGTRSPLYLLATNYSNTK